jgi:formylmethanofuran dehydrogenase subunit C
MSALSLTLREIPPQRIDLSPLTPEQLSRLSREDIGRIPLQCGNNCYSLDELFHIDGTDPGTLVIRNSSARLDAIGARMRAGCIHVEGDVGHYLGQGMHGGSLHVEGRAGHWAASGLAGGTVTVDGDCGNFAGAALPGDRRGMRGGTLLIRGNAGDRLGDHMRRGHILVRGDTGSYCGSRMIAGTVALLGSPGARAGYAMRRGTLLCGTLPEAALPPTFGDCGEHQLGFMPLLQTFLQRLDSEFARFGSGGIRLRRFVGDLAVGGNGELLTPV